MTMFHNQIEYEKIKQQLRSGYDSISDVITMPAQFYISVLSFLGDVNGLDIVDLGCGNGYLLEQIHSRNPDARLIGVDFSETLLHNARSRVPYAKLCCADLNVGIPFDSFSQDVIVSTEVIEHLVNPRRFLSEANRILKPNGMFVITFPNVDAWLVYRLLGEWLVSLAERIKIFKYFVPGEHPSRTLQPIDAMLRYRDVLAMVEASGFRIVETQGHEIFPGLFSLKGFRHIDFFHPWIRQRISDLANKLGTGRICYRIFLRCVPVDNEKQSS